MLFSLLCRYICLWTKKKIEAYFSEQLTFSNIRGKISHLYHCALQKCFPRRFSELDLGSKSTTVASQLADQDNKQNSCRTGEECKDLCLRRGLNFYREDIKRNRGKSGIDLQTQNFSYADPFLLDRLVTGD